jgi:hypothetical protein
VAPEADPKDREKGVDKAFRQRSPRGLIENVSEIQKWVWPEQSPEQLASLLADLNARGNPVTSYIQFWREFVRAIIVASGKNPDDYRGLAESETLDHVCAAARLMKQLDKVESLIGLAKRDPKRFVDAALGEALLLSSFVHQLDITDNETFIRKGEVQNKSLRQSAEDRTNRAQSDHPRYQARADELWARHRDWSAQQVANSIEREERTKSENASAKIEQGGKTKPKTKLLKPSTIRRLIRKK